MEPAREGLFSNSSYRSCCWPLTHWEGSFPPPCGLGQSIPLWPLLSRLQLWPILALSSNGSLLRPLLLAGITAIPMHPPGHCTSDLLKTQTESFPGLKSFPGSPLLPE